MVLCKVKGPLWWVQQNVQELIFGRSTQQIYPPVDLPMDLNGNFTVWAHIGRSTGRSTPPPPVDLPVDLNGNFTFLLSNVPFHRCFRWTRWQIYPPLVASSGQEWWFIISTVTALIGRWSGRSTCRSPPPVLASSGQEWQFYICTVRDEVADLPLTQYWNLLVKNRTGPD